MLEITNAEAIIAAAAPSPAHRTRKGAARARANASTARRSPSASLDFETWPVPKERASSPRRANGVGALCWSGSIDALHFFRLQVRSEVRVFCSERVHGGLGG